MPQTTKIEDPIDKELMPQVPDPLKASESSRELADNRDLMATTSAPIDKIKPEPITTGIQSNETVAGQMKELLSSGSAYLEQGRQKGLEFAAQRGMQNSTLAAQAGEQARVAAALPIAQQDASTFNQRSTLNQNTQNEFRAKEVDHVNRLMETAQQGDINSRLQMEQFGFNSELSAQENLQRLEELAFQGDINARQSYINYAYQTLLSDQQQGFAIELEDTRFQNQQQLVQQEFQNALGLTAADAANRLKELNQQHANTLNEIKARGAIDTGRDETQMALQLQGNYLSQVAARQQAGSQEIATIFQTEGLTTAQQNAAVQNAQRRMLDDIAMLGSFYSKSPQWDDDFSLSVAPTSTGGNQGATNASPPGTGPTPASPPLPRPILTGGGRREIWDSAQR